jgi:hypothetical protein
MGAPRKFAHALLRAVLRLAPLESRDWATAMERELDFIVGDWTALFWAMGSILAIFRHASRGWRKWISRENASEGRMNSTGKKVIGVVSGALLGLMLALSAFGLQSLVGLLFPRVGRFHMPWTHLLTVIAIPEAIFVTAAILLWRKRTPIAAGILLTGVLMGLHVVVHFAYAAR